MPPSNNDESSAVQVAKAFFQACTKLSDDNEDILPQEDGVDQKLSVFCLFSELFPEFANDKDRPDNTAGKHGLMRLQFNKIGYEMYDKEQSRRVPAVRAKPDNPGYGFRRARWRDMYVQGEDRRICETVLRTLGVSNERLERIKKRVNDFKVEWDAVRRPSRPAGPGRPRGHKRGPADPTQGPSEGTTPHVIFAVQQPTVAKKPKKGGARANNKPGEQKTGVQQLDAFCCDDTVPIPALVIDGAPWGVHQHTINTVLSDDKSLGEENSSLRALNMSLIYEREQLLVQIKHDDKEVLVLQAQLEKLIGMVSKRENGGEVAAAFQAVMNKVLTQSNSPEATQEIPAQYRNVLEKSVDAYEQYSNRLLHRENQCVFKCKNDMNNQDGFAELSSQAPMSSSCEDLRSLFRTSTPDQSASFRPTPIVGSVVVKRESESIEDDRSAHQWPQTQAAPGKDAEAHSVDQENGNTEHHLVLGDGGLDLEDSCGDICSYDHLFNSHMATAF